MNRELEKAREEFVQAMSRISHFWGFPKAMGAIYGAIYLSSEPLSLDEIVEQVGVTKGAVSTHVRALERLGMVHKQIRLGDRKDYYLAEEDFWKVIKSVLREREQQEFDLALRNVSSSLDMVDQAATEGADRETADFYRKRMENMQRFFNTLDNIVATLLALEELRLSSIRSLFGKKKNGDGESLELGQ
ncbi:MAG: GbsR/MarR family transcriptional regulator [Candidatus Promineifilaceae bacterium]